MKNYCTLNNGDCESCSLSSYNLDCYNNPIRRIQISLRVSPNLKYKLDELAKKENRTTPNYILKILQIIADESED
jgi:hypothetical protein